MKESTSAAWLAEIKKRMANLEKLLKRQEPRVSASTLQKLVDDTRRSVKIEARELAAAANILCEELMHENAKVGK